MTVELKGNTNKAKWSLIYDKTNRDIFSFSFGGNTLFQSEGVDLGGIKESQGLVKFIRPHFSDKIKACSVESDILLPFGSEPHIRRRCEQIRNIFRVTLDIFVPSGLAVDSVSVDKIKMNGDWSEFDTYTFKDGNGEIEKKTFPVSSLTDKPAVFESVPPVVVFRNADGYEIEFGAGYDLWRWANLEKFSASSSFSIMKVKDGIIFERKPLVWKEDYQISKFNFRYTWYFSWKNKISDAELNKTTRRKVQNLIMANGKLSPPEDSSFSLANTALPEIWPEQASVSGFSSPCFVSRQTEKLLKNYIRAVLNNNLKEREKNITLRGVNSYPCSKNNHLERKSDSSLIHWDYFYMIAFLDWANRFLADSEKLFHIELSESSPLALLPSALGLKGALF